MVTGEFNSGKSQFINTLLGHEYCQIGVLPTTGKICMIQYGQTVHTIEESETSETLRVPVNWLRDSSVVDTPGTNAIHKHHQQITHHFVPRADIVFFVTSIDRPFSNSERKFLSLICEWKKKVVVIINKADLVSISLVSAFFMHIALILLFCSHVSYNT